MSVSPDLQPPVPRPGDRLYALLRAALSAIPVAGGPATELLGAIVAPPLERRRQRWMVQMAEGLAMLAEEHRRVFDDLGSNEAFISAFVQASQAAIRAHQEEKLTSLRNAVLNSALGSEMEDDLHLTFIRFLDELTPSHLL